MRGNNRNALPSHIIFFDTETYKTIVNDDYEYHNLKLGVADYCYYSKREKKWYEERITFRKPEEFWDFVIEKAKAKTKLYVFAHNIHFDFAVVQGFEMMKKYGLELQRWIVDSNRFILRAKKGDKNFVFLDSGNIIKVKLKTLGEHLGLPKLKVDFDTVGDKELEIYCSRDVEILKQFVLNYIEFIRKENLGNFKYTIAGQSFTAFRHKFMNQEIFIHANPKAIMLERESYKGGRTEAWYIGHNTGTFYLLDINSMYPYVMHEFKYPTKLYAFFEKVSKKDIKTMLEKGYLIISKVKIKTNEPVFGLRKERLLFPVGEYWVTLTTPELKYALEHNMIQEISTTAIYQGARIFKSFVEYFYNKRKIAKKNKDGVMSLFYKLILNSLYGKFGQKNEKWKFVKELPEKVTTTETVIDYKTHKKETYIAIDGKVYKKEGEGEAFDAFVAIASHVTAYARMHLWSLIKKAGFEHIFYMDTDSLLVDEQGRKNLTKEIDNLLLGKLKVEAIYHDIEIHGPKDYRFDKKVKIKGIRKDAVKISENEYKQMQFLKTRSLIRKNMLKGAVVHYQIKKLKRQYLKGIITDSGRVIPIEIKE